MDGYPQEVEKMTPSRLYKLLEVNVYCGARDGAKPLGVILKGNETTLQRVSDNCVACVRLGAGTCGLKQYYTSRRGVPRGTQEA